MPKTIDDTLYMPHLVTCKNLVVLDGLNCDLRCLMLSNDNINILRNASKKIQESKKK